MNLGDRVSSKLSKKKFQAKIQLKLDTLNKVTQEPIIHILYKN